MLGEPRIPHIYPCRGRYPGRDRLTRREMLQKSAGGLGGIALAWLFSHDQRSAAASSVSPSTLNLLPKRPHFKARAKNVIFLYMGGGPSQMDLLDPKPQLQKYDGKPIPFSITQRDLNGSVKLLGSPFKFARHGQSGIEVSELLPNLATVVDEITVIRSGVTNRIDHGEALLMMHTGRPISGFPTIGSWITYGLGSDNANLPAYIAISDAPGERTRNATSAGWLPALFQGTLLNAGSSSPFYYLNAPTQHARDQRAYLDLTQALNRMHQAERAHVSQLDARIQNFELAARMQVEVTQQMDLSNEPQWLRSMYGLDHDKTRDFGRRCLIARRLVETGVRFVHVLRNDWDHHSGLKSKLSKSCAEVDQPVAALLKDLKHRGLLDETLVVWTGEFGRLPVVEGSDGRDHNPFGYSLWMAGGGIRGGMTYGSTDDFSYAATQNPVTNADLHATMLHLLGLDHAALTFPFEGRDESLTGVEPARIVKDIIA